MTPSSWHEYAARALEREQRRGRMTIRVAGRGTLGSAAAERRGREDRAQVGDEYRLSPSPERPYPLHDSVLEQLADWLRS